MIEDNKLYRNTCLHNPSTENLDFLLFRKKKKFIDKCKVVGQPNNISLGTADVSNKSIKCHIKELLFF